MIDAFRICDDTLRQGIQGVTDLITIPGLINLDFADIRTVMKDAGTAMMGIGISTGENRALDAAQQATSSSLLESSIAGASRVLFSIAGGPYHLNLRVYLQIFLQKSAKLPAVIGQ